MSLLSAFTSALRGANRTATRSFAAPSGMTVEMARAERMFMLMAQTPDPDEALRRAGIARHQLRVVEMDDEVTAALDTRREAVIGTPWRLEGGTQRWRDELSAELRPHMENLLRGAFASVPYGYSVVEVVYVNRPTGRAGIASVAEKPMEWFIPQADGRTVRFKTVESGPDGQEVDPRKFLLTARNQTLRNPYGEALLSRVYWPWFFRQAGWQFWMRWLERFGTPLLLGKTAGDPQQLAENLADALAGAALAVGQGDEVVALTPATGTGHFEGFDNVICRRIQKLILGQTLTTDASSGGSLAAARVADGVRTDRRNADLRLVAATVQRLVAALWEFNGRGGESPQFVMADDTGLEMERATRDAILVEKVGVRLTETYIAERYDLEPEDFTLADPAGNASAAGQAPPGGANGGGTGADTPPANFAAADGFTPVQQGLEERADALLATVPEPIDVELVRAAVLAARDEADLRARLSALVGKADPRFAELLDRASFAAAVLGYVAAEERRT